MSRVAVAVGLLVAIVCSITTLTRAAPAHAALVQGCSRFDTTMVDEIAVAKRFDPTESEPTFELPGITKEHIDDPGPNVALLIDRSRLFHSDVRSQPGVSGRFGAWRCSTRHQFRCSATLIAPEWVLTAAHCVSAAAVAPTTLAPVKYETIETFDLMARTASTESRRGGNLTTVVEQWIHPQWRMQVNHDQSWVGDYWDMANDLALLRLAEPVDVAPARLAEPGRIETMQDSPLISTGWGFTPEGELGVLHQWTSYLVDDAECDEVDGSGPFRAPLMLCTDELDGSGTCVGDSGGPLAILDQQGTYHIAAVTSFVLFPDLSATTCDRSRFGSFTELLPEHHEWIAEIIASSR